jgi:hypothetical protein
LIQRLDASDAISPAWRHVRRMLPSLRDWRLVLKLGAVAFFAHIGGCNGNFNSIGRRGHGHVPGGLASAGALAVLAGAAVLALVVGLLLFYLTCRLQLVLFDLVLRQQTRVAPVWNRSGSLVWRWIGWTLLFALVVVGCCAVVAVPFIVFFLRIAHGAHSGAPVAAHFMLAVLTGVIAVILLLLVLGTANVLFADLMLPSLALEGAGLGEALRRVSLLFRAEPGQVLLYVLLRSLLSLGGAAAGYTAVALFGLVLALPLGGLAALLWAGLRHGGAGAHAAMIAGWVVLGTVLLTAMVLAMVAVIGYLFLFLQAYALYFLAGRYPLLGMLLEGGPDRPFTPPPPARSPEEEDDGPGFPMDPALA